MSSTDAVGPRPTGGLPHPVLVETPQEATAKPAGPRPDSSPAAPAANASGWDPDAAEEITFQFGETAEERTRAAETRLEYDEPESTPTVHIEVVHRVMQLMEGRDAYLLLRQKAAEFARAYVSGRTDAAHLLEMESLGEAQRYALRRMTLDVLERRGRESATARFHAEQSPGTEDASVLGAGVEFEGGFALPADGTVGVGIAQAATATGYFRTLAIDPTLRAVFDAIVSAGGVDQAAVAMRAIQAGWGRDVSLRTAQDIGVFVGVTRLVSLVASVVASGRTFVSEAGRIDPPPGLPFQCARSMLELGVSSVPATPVDRLVSLVALPSTPPKTRMDLLASLFRLASRWPDPIWASNDTRWAVLQFITRQRAVPVPARERARPARLWRLTRERLMRDWPGEVDDSTDDES